MACQTQSHQLYNCCKYLEKLYMVRFIFSLYEKLKLNKIRAVVHGTKGA
jgi:hypothetical protein